MTFANLVGFPVLVRPSYVLSGAAMRVIDNEEPRIGAKGGGFTLWAAVSFSVSRVLLKIWFLGRKFAGQGDIGKPPKDGYGSKLNH